MRTMNPFEAVPKALRGWVIPATIIALWWAAFEFEWGASRLLVSIGAVLQVAWEQLFSVDFHASLGASLYRMAIGFVIGSVLGLLVGGAMGLSRTVDRLVGPLFHAIKQVSHFAWIPLISVWFGMGDTGKIAFLSMAAFFPLVLNTFEGVRSVGADLVDVARVYRYSRWQLFRRVVLPAATPSILTGVQLAVIYSWSACLGAEYLLQAGKGIGNVLQDGQEHFLMDLVIFGVIVVGLVGFLINRLAHAIEVRLLRWCRGAAAQF